MSYATNAAKFASILLATIFIVNLAALAGFYFFSNDAIIFCANLISLVLVVVLSFALRKNLFQSKDTAEEKFLSAASHEFRTPLTVIRGYVDMLETYGDDKEIFLESVKAIKISAKNLQLLLENLLFIARAEQNNLTLQKTKIELNELLKIVVESFHNPRINFVRGEDFFITGDEKFLKKMFTEFIENALNFSSGSVVVELKNSPVTVKIVDTGIGIKKDDQQKIFEKFFRVDKSRTKIEENKISAGLGLTIAKYIAESHKIKIKIISEIDKGTTIICKF